MSSSNVTVNGVYCGDGGGADTYFGLRVASVFIIMATSAVGALFPVLTRRTQWLNAIVPTSVFQTAKYFGSGVIIATAFIHLLSPAMAELGSPCLAPAWQNYPYALGISLVSIFAIFIVELVAFRWGTAKLAKLGLRHDPHGHNIGAQGAHAAHGPEGIVGGEAISSGGAEKFVDDESEKDTRTKSSRDVEAQPSSTLSVSDSALAQIIGVAILEFGVLLHSILIGMTLAVDPSFKILFVVIVFHQMFEGLGIGSRLAFMQLPSHYTYVPILGACLYAITTPIGIATGLGIRTTYNPNSATASIVSGVLDAFSSGILIYTGLVELMAHEFVFNREMIEGSNRKLAWALGCMVLGAGLMALLGRWA
ncbi:ZIP-like iron-zinc transporter [Sparassis latifolia]